MPAPLTAPTPARHPPSKLRITHGVWLLALLIAWLLGLSSAHAEEPMPSELWLSLFMFSAPAPPPRVAVPLPLLETKMHTAIIGRIATDEMGRWAVTASDDKTARLWDVKGKKLLKVLRPPQETANEGKLYAIAISHDGRHIAAAGWTGPAWHNAYSIYLYQHDFESNHVYLKRRLGDLPNAIAHLSFSQDGRWLAAGLIGQHGVRVFNVKTGQLTGEDAAYNGDCYSVEFSPYRIDKHLQLLSSSDDGKLRLHNIDEQGRLSLFKVKRTTGGRQPVAARFSPSGQRIAVGFHDTKTVQILDSLSLTDLFKVDTKGVDNGNFSSIAWSADGRNLVAAGQWAVNNKSTMRRWSSQDGKILGDISLSSNTVMDLVPLPQGGWLFAAQDPAWGILDAQGNILWRTHSQLADFRGQYNQFQTSRNGEQVRFAFSPENSQMYTFNSRKQKFYSNNFLDDLIQKLIRLLDFLQVLNEFIFQNIQERLPFTWVRFSPARVETSGLKIESWQNRTQPQRNGQPIKLQQYEVSRSLAVDSNGQGFVLGTEWQLHAYQRDGQLQWQQPVPGVVWAVNQSEDGRWVVAGYGDGTIRWHRRQNGQEVLALFAHPDGKRWVLWTPEGFYAASEGGEDLFGYHLNRGKDQDGEFVSARQLRETFYRPELLSQRLSAKGDERMREAVAALGDVRQLLARAGAPALRLRSAANVTTDEDGQYTPEVEVEALGDAQAGKPRLVVRIDDVEVSDARWNAPVLASPQRVILPMLKLPEGEHRVSVELVDGRGVASSAVTARVKVPPSRQRAQGTLHLLAVGVSQYHNSSLNLKFAAADAEAMVAKVRERGGALFGQNVVAKALIDANATVAKIDTTLREMVKNAKPHDTFVLYLAGHGVTVGSGVGEYHFLPHELEWNNEKPLHSQAVRQNKLREWLSWLPVRSLLLLDTCQAGNAISLARAEEDNTALSTLAQVSKRSVIVASSKNTVALEGHQGHGIFTWAVLDAMDNGDYDENQVINTDEIGLHVRKWVPKISESKFHYRMVPMQDIVGQPFPVALPLKLKNH